MATREEQKRAVAAWLLIRDTSPVNLTPADFLTQPARVRQKYIKEARALMLLFSKWKSPEEFLSKIMKAEKSGWDDCCAFLRR